MINRTLYALRHKPTGRCMPETHGSYSCWEPVDEEPHPVWPPIRLFATKRSAQNALTAYLWGRWEATVESEGSWEEGYYDYRGTPAPTGKAEHPRVRSDFEIVTLLLQEQLDANR